MTAPPAPPAIDTLRDTMRRFHVYAGEPAIRALARETNMATGTVQSALRTPERSTWISLSAVAAALAGPVLDAIELRNQHRAARAEYEARPRPPVDGDDTAYLVLRSHPQFIRVVVGDRHLADATARAEMALLVALPVLADYRTVDPQTTDPDEFLHHAVQRNQAALDRLGDG